MISSVLNGKAAGFVPAVEDELADFSNSGIDVAPVEQLPTRDASKTLRIGRPRPQRGRMGRIGQMGRIRRGV